MNKTKIDWADSTWNPVTGCLHGCEYCYARRMANRFGNKYLPFGDGINEIDRPLDGEKGVDPYPYGFDPTLHRYRLDDYKNKKGRTIFVCSMADLFGEWVPDEWIQEVFKACEAAPQHRYLFLTKNPKRYIDLELRGILKHNDNFWYGTTITKPTDELVWVKDAPNKTFASIEPILEPFGELDADELPNWIIVGAETGKRKDKVIPEKWWVDEIVGHCKAANMPVFMKESLRNIMGNDFIQEFPWEV